MNAPKDASTREENSQPVDSALHELPCELDVDNERVRSALGMLTSNSAVRLEELMSSLQDVREFLKLEAERVEREVANYALLQQSVASAATRILTETIGRKPTTVSGEGVRQLFGVREKLKRWPSG
jgi:hypothetical protein